MPFMYVSCGMSKEELFLVVLAVWVLEAGSAISTVFILLFYFETATAGQLNQSPY